MAWLYIWRRKVRSMLVIWMIGISMSVMLSIQGLYDGMLVQMIDSTIRSESGEVTVYAKAYRLHENLKYHLSGTEKRLGELEKLPEVRTAVKRIRMTGLASTARKSTTAKLVGIEMAKEREFGNFDAFVIEGTTEEFGEKGGAVIGKKLAEDLNVTVGSRVIFSAQNVHNEITSLSLRIKAIVYTVNPAVDNFCLFMPFEQALKTSELGKDESTEIALRVKKDVEATTAKKLIETKDTEVYTWLELYPALQQMQQIMVIFNGISFAIVMVMVFIGILGVMVVSILERIREFGILLAIGEPYRTLRMQIFYEALILGLGGYILGSIIGLTVLYRLYAYGLDLREFSAGLEAFGMNSIIYADIKWLYFTTTFAAILLAALLSVVVPLRRLKKVEPVEVIKEAK